MGAENTNKNDAVVRIMQDYGNSIYRMSYFLLQNEQDAQDILQETLIKYMQKAPVFDTADYEKAWLLRVANNLCKDMLRFQKKNRHANIEDLLDMGITQEDCSLLTQVWSLPEKYKRVIYLHYYEGYSVLEMADILGITESAVKKRLERGRCKLREMLKEER